MQGKFNTHYPNKWTMILLGTLSVLAAVFLVKNFDYFFPEKLIVVDTQINANQNFVDEHLGIELNSPQNLGTTQIKFERKTTEIDGQESIKRIVNIQPTMEEKLDANLVFHYKERELNQLDEEQLILYSSEDGGQTWNPHIGTKRDLTSNKLSLENIQNGAMWTAATASLNTTTTSNE